eukprot:CCRYP_001771-RA/>CCRYP_001771-RA protein AED:0.26 eAED:0.26 QI:0/-1/0/1/-1/1/1/0/371
MFTRTRTIASKTQTHASLSTSSSTTTTQDSNSTISHPLTIVSWNISSANPSLAAPDPRSRLDQAPRLIRDECLGRTPDVIALQETASSGQGNYIFEPLYVSIGTRVALHTNEYIDLLIKKETFPEYSPISLERGLPAVAALLTFRGTKIAVASIHLPHTKEAAPLRQRLCEAIMKCIVAQGVDDIILIGDFNMRKDEDRAIEQLAGGGWIDVWKELTNSDKSKMFTWNGRENMYHGPASFRFTARFDRCYARGDKLRLQKFDLIGNRPVKGIGDYLSDHYGLFVCCDVVATSMGVGNHAKRHYNADEVRRLRMQRFESASSSNQNQVDEGCNEVSTIDLTGDSDDELARTDIQVASSCKRRKSHTINEKVS